MRHAVTAIRLLLLVGGIALLVNAIIIFPLVYNVGKFFQLFVAAACILFSAFYPLLLRVTSTGFPRLLRWAAYAGFLFVLLTTAAIAVIGQRNTADFREDAVIVLGGSLRGEKVSRTVAERLDAAVAYWEHNPRVLLVVSGGQGADEAITEAEAMRRYLLAKGIPEESILKEEQSTNTAENFRFSKALLDERFAEEEYRAVCITNTFHAYRAQRLAETNGIAVARYSADTPLLYAPSSYLREFAAVIKLWIFKT